MEIPRFEGLALLNRPLTELPGYRLAFRRRGRLRASSAERHLLTVYREEVAWLLYRACVSALYSNTRTYANYVAIDRRLEPVSTEDLAKEQRHLQKVAPAGALEEKAALTVLSNLVPVRPEFASRLATASIELVERSNAKICLSLALDQDGHRTQAKQILRKVISSRPIALETSIAYNNLGRCHQSDGEFAIAREMFRMAALEARNPAPAVSWLWEACSIGDARDARFASDHLDELLTPDHPALDEYLAKRSTKKGLGPAFVSTTTTLADKVGPAARKALHVPA